MSDSFATTTRAPGCPVGTDHDLDRLVLRPVSPTAVTPTFVTPTFVDAAFVTAAARTAVADLVGGTAVKAAGRPAAWYGTGGRSDLLPTVTAVMTIPVPATTSIDQYDAEHVRGRPGGHPV